MMLGAVSTLKLQKQPFLDGLYGTEALELSDGNEVQPIPVDDPS